MSDAPDVACTNAECSEFNVAKSNPGGFPATMILCGGCGGPVEEVGDVPPADAT